MTLVAAFKVVETPYLAADLMITRPSPGGPPQLSTLRRKIVQVSDRLVIAWSGSLVGAHLLVDALTERASGIDSLEMVETFLTTFPVADIPRQELVIAGWVGPTEGFHWSAKSPGVVTAGDSWFFGTGGRAAEPDGLIARALSEVYDPTLVALNMCARLTADELDEQRHRAHGFGFAYDMVRWDEARFVTVSDVHFSRARAAFNAEKECVGMRYENESLRTRSEDNWVFLKWHVRGGRTTGGAVGPTTAVDDPRPAMRRLEAFVREAWHRPRYLCVMVSFHPVGETGDVRRELAAIPLVEPGNEPSPQVGVYTTVEGLENEEVFALQPGHLESLFRFITGA